jgi:SEC-C motif-containing protein
MSPPKTHAATVSQKTLACPCREGLTQTTLYADCCGRYHHGPLRLQAPNAEALMRSRYSAFVLDLTDYLLQTWHATTRPSSIEPNVAGLRWLGLEVKRHTVLGPNSATVEFVARSKLGGRAHRMHEISGFVLEDGHWFYVEALSDPGADSA